MLEDKLFNLTFTLKVKSHRAYSVTLEGKLSTLAGRRNDCILYEARDKLCNIVYFNIVKYEAKDQTFIHSRYDQLDSLSSVYDTVLLP